MIEGCRLKTYEKRLTELRYSILLPVAVGFKEANSAMAAPMRIYKSASAGTLYNVTSVIQTILFYSNSWGHLSSWFRIDILHTI